MKLIEKYKLVNKIYFVSYWYMVWNFEKKNVVGSNNKFVLILTEVKFVYFVCVVKCTEDWNEILGKNKWKIIMKTC